MIFLSSSCKRNLHLTILLLRAIFLIFKMKPLRTNSYIYIYIFYFFLFPSTTHWVSSLAWKAWASVIHCRNSNKDISPFLFLYFLTGSRVQRQFLLRTLNWTSTHPSFLFHQSMMGTPIWVEFSFLRICGKQIK